MIVLKKKPMQTDAKTPKIIALKRSAPAVIPAQKKQPAPNIYSENPNDPPTPYTRWLKNKTSIRKSVNAKCYDCVCGEQHAKRIRFCCIFKCPLWYVRPYRKGITQDMCLEHDETRSTYTKNKRPVIVKSTIQLRKK